MISDHYFDGNYDMTLKGKRKALNDNPQAQISAIAAAFGGKVPVKPLTRRSPQVAWKEGDIYHIAKLTRTRLYHLTSETIPRGTAATFRDPNSACGYLAQRYYRKVSLPDLQAATAGPVSAPTLAEAQQAIICWIQDWSQARQSDIMMTTWQYCIVSPDGIRSGTTQGKPRPVEGFPGPLMVVFNVFGCKQLLRRAFKLDIQDGQLRESFNKMMAVSKVVAVQENAENVSGRGDSGTSSSREGEKRNFGRQKSISG